MQKYGGQSAAVLFDVTRTTMPQLSPASLPPEHYASLFALMLRENDIVPGETPLPTDFETLTTMMIPAGGVSFMTFSPYTAKPVVDIPRSLDDFKSVDDADSAYKRPYVSIGIRRGVLQAGRWPIEAAMQAEPAGRPSVGRVNLPIRDGNVGARGQRVTSCQYRPVRARWRGWWGGWRRDQSDTSPWGGARLWRRRRFACLG